MIRPRVIPVVSIDHYQHAVKTIQFSSERYLGSAFNVLKIFSELGADELILTDIKASKQRRLISLNLVEQVASRIQVPLAVGGGIASRDNIRDLLSAGADKVIIGEPFNEKFSLIRHAVDSFGSSTIVACLDLIETGFGTGTLYSHTLRRNLNCGPLDIAKQLEEVGVGELIVQDVSRDGCMRGFNTQLFSGYVSSLEIPVVVLGGAGSFDHILQAARHIRPSGFASGSAFCYPDNGRGVLLNYPGPGELYKLTL